MGSAKDIVVRIVDAKTARDVVRRFHYSRRVVVGSSLHFGVYMHGRLLGAMQFGSPLDSWKTARLFENGRPGEVLELNRMAFDDALTRNSESRAIGIAVRMIRKYAPAVRAIQSFADAVRCGDGAIYRAAGFALTQVRKNSDLYVLPNGVVTHKISVHSSRGGGISKAVRGLGQTSLGVTKGVALKRAGAKKAEGFQLRYMLFLDEEIRARFKGEIVPYSRIAESGAGMYRGKRRAGSADGGTPSVQDGGGGSIPTPALPAP